MTDTKGGYISEIMAPKVTDNIELSIRDLSKTFFFNNTSFPVLNKINLDIQKNELVVIVGVSGCGKSTLLRIMAGLETQDGGSLFHGNQEIHGPSSDRGMAFQEHRLFPWLTIWDNIGFGIRHLPEKERNKRIGEQIALVGLNGFEKSYPRQLSGGMAQRAGIARALAARPTVLLLDEPFGALDALTKVQMQEEIIKIWDQEKTTMVLVTHDIEEAVFLADRVVVMDKCSSGIKKIVSIELPRPRDRNNHDFTYYKKILYKEFFAETPMVQAEYLI